MKKITGAFLLFYSLSFCQTGDSLSYYKEKAKAYEQKLNSDSSRILLSEFEKREAELKSEMEDREIFYKTRIDKLQTLLIGSIVSSVVVIAFSFYILNKKKAKDKK